MALKDFLEDLQQNRILEPVIVVNGGVLVEDVDACAQHLRQGCFKKQPLLHVQRRAAITFQRYHRVVPAAGQELEGPRCVFQV